MSTIRDLHREAMNIADLAEAAKRDDRDDDAISLYRQAFRLEAQAARTLVDRLQDEPSRSILYQSAAALALKGGEFGEVPALVETALAGNPPGEVRAELERILELSNSGNGEQSNSGEQITIKGTLYYAESTPKVHRLKLMVARDISSTGRCTVIVPKSIPMKRIVRTLWGTSVAVTGTRLKNGHILLSTINAAS